MKTCSGESDPPDNGIPPKKNKAEAKQKSTPILGLEGLNEQVEEPCVGDFLRCEQKRTRDGHPVEKFTDSTSITTMFSDSGPTYFSPQGTHTGSLGGTCWNSSHCGRMSITLANGAQITAHTRGTPTRPPANSVDLEVHLTSSKRRNVDSKAAAEGRQTSGIPTSISSRF